MGLGIHPFCFECLSFSNISWDLFLVFEFHLSFFSLYIRCVFDSVVLYFLLTIFRYFLAVRFVFIVHPSALMI